MSRPDNKAVAFWLLACCVLVYAMIVLGGVTRLTQSGLSMVDWDPVMGIVPPLTDSDWRATFEQYRQFPEYQKVNRGMSLAEFKKIFYVEYAHRVLGRLIGIAFLIPFLWFAATGRINRPMIPRFAAMFVLGGLQGLLGWFMVMSGLVDRPSVSQYRLTAHLMLAVFIYGFMLWTALHLWRGTGQGRVDGGAGPYRVGWLATAVVGVMFVSGGFVAGTRAGFVYNTFPLMAGGWVPDGMWAMSPAWLNLFENVVTIQFVHRLLAVVVAAVVVFYWARSRHPEPGAGVRLTGNLMLLALGAQLVLGVATLVQQVPTALGAAHQAGAVALLTMVLIHTHVLKYRRAEAVAGRQPDAGDRPVAVQRGPEPL